MKTTNLPFMLVLYGPTGVGKTDLALALAEHIPVEIINMDVGQFYTPLSIGTAKPDWKHSTVAHHLFDIIDAPAHCTVTEYRSLVYKKIQEIRERGRLPILVGGSGFYLHVLLFPTQAAIPDVDISLLYPQGVNVWQEIFNI